MTNPIIARADALMQRSRRPAGADDEIPLLTDAIDEEEDGLPVLIDVASDNDASSLAVSPSTLEPPPPASPQEHIASAPDPQATTLGSEPRPAVDPVFRDLLAGEVAARVERRIGELLPGIVNETVCEVLTELVEGQAPK